MAADSRKRGPVFKTTRSPRTAQSRPAQPTGSPLSLSLLGRFRLTGARGDIDLGSRKLCGLLAFLACTAPVPQAREKLSALLWGSHFDNQARQNLRQALTRLRKVLGQDALESDGEIVSLNPAVVRCDVSRFEALIREDSRDALSAAANLYRGRLIDDVNVSEEGWNEWLTGERERLLELALGALVGLGEQELAVGRAEHALKAGRRAIALNNMREDAHRLIIQALSATGRKAEALTHYQDLVALLKRELDVEPDAATVSLVAGLRKPQATRPEPKAKSGAAFGSNSAPDTSAVGPHLPDGDLPVGERKLVTALYVDLKKSLELVAQRDPEEALRILEAILKLITQAVHRYEGTVTLETGDGIMALFGVPLALEDHAVRACYAALQIQEAVTRYAEGLQRPPITPILVRAGLNSGEVVIRSIARGLRPEFRAIGQTTHHAARLGQIAVPGTSLVSAETLRLAEGYVQVRMLEGDDINPLGEPLYELVGLGPSKTRFLARASRGLTRFIGRNAELKQFHRIQQLAGSGHGQVVAVVGEAGVGKSRFVYEVTHSHGLRGWLTLEGASVSYGNPTSYLPVINLLKSYFKIHDRDDLRGIREKVTGKLLTLDEALKPTLPALLALLDVPVDNASWQTLDPGQRRELTLDAVKRLLLREAREQPLLLIFEDLHWIDSETQALLDGLVESLGSARLLLLVNYRSGYQHALGGKTFYSQMRLDVLSAESTGELLDALLGDDPGLASLKQLLVRRGNPFFLEETVRALVETKALAGKRGRYRLVQPIQALKIPATVHAMLAARIDRLHAKNKRLLQAASVVGKVVSFVLLQAIADLPDEALRAGLGRLKSAEFLYETGLDQDLEYSFTHALTHEVTYAGLLQERRCELHARIVEAIETVYPDRLDELVGILAQHAFRGEQWGNAVTYLRRAGAKAALRSASVEAAERFEEALAAVEHLPRTRTNLERAIELRFLLRNPLFVLAEFGRALEILTEVVHLAEDLGEPERVGLACSFMANAHFMMGNLERGFELAERAQTIGVEASNLRIQAMTCCHLGQLYYVQGDYAQALSMLVKADECIEAAPSSQQLNFVQVYGIVNHCFQAFVLARLGRFPEALESGERCQRITETTDTPFCRALASWALGSTYLSRGELAGAVALLEASYADCCSADIRALRPWIATELGLAHLLSSRAGEALRLLNDAVDQAAALNLLSEQSLRLAHLGEAHLAAGRRSEAAQCAAQGLELSIRHGERGFRASILRFLGEIASCGDERQQSEAEGRLGEALALAEELRMRPLAAHCHLGLGKLYRRTSKPDLARDHFAAATAMYREMDMRFWLERAEAEIHEL